MSTDAGGGLREGVARAADRRRQREARSRWLRLGAVAAAVLAADQITKGLVRGALAVGEARRPMPGVTIRRVDNEGIAFGLFPGRGGVVAVLTLAAMCAIAVILSEVARRHPVVPWGGGALVGGSIGNMIDRITRGAVTDFVKMPGLDNYFNVADAGITCGALLIAFGLWRSGEDVRVAPS